ncbi:MAG: KAP family NTPase [Flavobacteriales bacterium]|jgi:hypothetical protein|nr:KAP family NTPase [Flavobacteriales bacterium]
MKKSPQIKQGNIQITEIIKEYLDCKTDYSILINGKHGIGKTYFYKEILSPEIQNINLPQNAAVNYKPIYISLFGQSTIESINDSIFLEIYPILKNKKLKIGFGLGKLFIKNIIKLNDTDLNDISTNAKAEVQNLEELVICFDDLDRMDEALSQKSFFGYVNTLVENYGIKVIIITSEEHIELASLFKDKVIGINLQYTPNYNQVLNNIINDIYKDEKEYLKFLDINSSLILNYLKLNNYNLRSLKFALEKYRNIYSSLVINLANEKLNDKTKNHIILSILKFTLEISFDYKIGNINITNFDVIKNLYTDSYTNLSSNKIIDLKEKEKFEFIFWKKYKLKEKSNFYNSIFNYVSGQSHLDILKVINEIKLELNIYNGIIDKNEILFIELSYPLCLSLSDQDYKNNLNELLETAYKGDIKLNRYPELLLLVLRFDNLLELDLNSLLSKLKNGAKKSSKKSTYNNSFNRSKKIRNNFLDTDFTLYNELFTYCKKLNDEIFDSGNDYQLKQLFNYLKDDVYNFRNQLDESYKNYKDTPFWQNFNLDEIYKVIMNYDRNNIVHLIHYFKNRYKNIDSFTFDKLTENEYLKELIIKINEPESRNEKTIDNSLLDELTKSIQASIDVLIKNDN